VVLNRSVSKVPGCGEDDGRSGTGVVRTSYIDSNSGCGPTLSPVQWVLDYLSPGVNGPECEASCSVVCGTEVKSA
jgi:hypothetical protein